MSWSPSFFRACKNNKTNSEIEVIDKLDKRILLPPPHPSNGLGFSCFLNYYFFFYMLVKVYRISLPAPPTHPPHPFFKNDVTCLYCVVNFMAVVVQVSDVAYGPRVLFIQFWWILFLLFLTFFVDDKARRNCSEVDCLLTHLYLYLINVLGLSQYMCIRMDLFKLFQLLIIYNKYYQTARV